MCYRYSRFLSAHHLNVSHEPNSNVARSCTSSPFVIGLGKHPRDLKAYFQVGLSDGDLGMLPRAHQSSVGLILTLTDPNTSLLHSFSYPDSVTTFDSTRLRNPIQRNFSTRILLTGIASRCATVPHQQSLRHRASIDKMPEIEKGDKGTSHYDPVMLTRHARVARVVCAL